MGLTPDQFWGLTPYEFARYREGFLDRRDDLFSVFAGFFARLITSWVKGTVRGASLYRRRDAPPEFADEKEFNAHMREQEEERDRLEERH